MRRLWRLIRRRYLTASVFLAGFAVVAATGAVLPARDRSAVAVWASTSVANLEHHPVGSLVLSAFIAGGSAWGWLLLIALGMFGANRALGNRRTALICVAGHVIGTLVSEGIVAYRVNAGLLPVSSRYLLDVGPSYVVVSAIVLGLAFGSWPARLAAALDLAVLVLRRPDLRRAHVAGRGRGRPHHRDRRRRRLRAGDLGSPGRGPRTARAGRHRGPAP